MDPQLVASVNSVDANPATTSSVYQEYSSQEDAGGSSESGPESVAEHISVDQRLKQTPGFQSNGQLGHPSTKLAQLSAGINEAISLSFTPISNAAEPLEAAAITSPEQTATQHTEQAHIPFHFENDSNTPSNSNVLHASLESIVPSGVNIQALLDQLAPSLSTQLTPSDSTTLVSNPQESVTPSTAAQNEFLPPRPLPLESASVVANYTPNNDITTNHASSQSNDAGKYQSQDPAPAYATPSTPAHHPLPSPGFLKSPQLSKGEMRHGSHDDEEPFSAELDREYDQFIREERTNVAEGNWDKFPDGSRLFIGNLPTEKVSKRDVFHRFRRYGKLAQISLKQAYGFVQFLDANSCSRAREVEQDKPLKGRKMHLEISRPQKKNARDRDGRRRSRSPERDRNRNDRYSGSGSSLRDKDIRRNRDDYRPGRSPSPRGHRPARSVDQYNIRRRSRSRTPPGRHHDHRRAPSDDLPLPLRPLKDVPEIQIIVVDDLDRQFIAYAENTFRNREIRCDVLILSPRLSEAAVIRRQIVEGVLGVVRLTRMHQATGKLSLQLFDQSAGADKVKFEQYEDLDPHVTAELVLRARSTHRAPSRSLYQPPPVTYGLPPTYGMHLSAPAQQPAAVPDVSDVLAQLGSRPDLQGLIAQLQQSQALAGASNPTANMNSDVARYLAGAVSQQPQAYRYPAHQSAHQSTQQPTQQAIDLVALLSNNAAGNQMSHGVMQNARPVNVHLGSGSSPPAQPDMQQLMAQLANYGGSR